MCDVSLECPAATDFNTGAKGEAEAMTLLVCIHASLIAAQCSDPERACCCTPAHSWTSILQMKLACRILTEECSDLQVALGATLLNVCRCDDRKGLTYTNE